jgi:transcription termination/antitermination protein NusG
MPEYMNHEASSKVEDDLFNALTADMHYGCIFCKTGQESIIAHSLTKKYEVLRALTVSQLKHKSVNGIKSLAEQILLPGYVLFRAYEENPPISDLQCEHGVIKVMRNTSGDWRLDDNDRRFASWVFNQGGLIGVSKAYAVGDKVSITSGPLKDYEGSIIKIDRRSRNGLVEIHFGERAWRIWLAFEFLL